MKKMVRILIEAGLVVLIIGVGWFDFEKDSPEMERTPPPAEPKTVTNGRIPDERRVGSEELRSPPDIASIFGWRPPPPPLPMPVPKKTDLAEKEKPPVKAEWLMHVGTVVGDGGRQTFIFKDSRRNRIIRSVEGEVQDGYRLLRKEDGQFLLEREGERYLVTIR